mmetsp:Transcript_11217/g.21379  ORF Transcript_11217/g.21379 Transcript_11217/m.21379 type:complete len:325 (-) Transcript_11217:73-1047(-)
MSQVKMASPSSSSSPPHPPLPNTTSENNISTEYTNNSSSPEMELGSTAASVVVPVASTQIRPAVEVVAPVDMAAGFRFPVTLGMQVLQVQVPEGGTGVVAGQRFAAWVISEQNDTTMMLDGEPAAVGWRDGFFRCFKYGVCHPMLCLACWCTPCVLGQVMTRAKLDILANPRWPPTETTVFWTPFKFLWALTAAYIFMRGITEAIIDYKVDSNNNDDKDTEDTGDDTDDDEYPSWAETLIFFRFLVFLSFAIFILILMIKTRQFVRKKDHIPAETCGAMEDCCVSFFCPCCTVCHLARHTNDYDRYSARCCTDTGLADDAPFYV